MSNSAAAAAIGVMANADAMRQYLTMFGQQENGL
jgi:hypothetical protein